MENFKKLNVWLKAHHLVLEVYDKTKNYPKTELFCLVNQMRRAAISVPANIAEGSKRKTPKDRKHFMIIAETSLEELKYYFLLSYELRYIDKKTGEDMTNSAREVGKMINGFIKSIN